MAKWANDKIMDKGLEYLLNNADRIIACTGQPADYNDAITDAPTGKKLSIHPMAPLDFIISDSQSSGRQLVIAGKSSIAVDTSGEVNHLALADSTSLELLYVTTIANSQQVYTGNSLSIPSWTITIADPT